MWEIWTNLLLPKALKTCPMSNNLANLVTLLIEIVRLDTRQGDQILQNRENCPTFGP